MGAFVFVRLRECIEWMLSVVANFSNNRQTKAHLCVARAIRTRRASTPNTWINETVSLSLPRAVYCISVIAVGAEEVHIVFLC